MAKKKTKTSRGAKAAAENLGLDYAASSDCYIVPKALMEAILDLVQQLDLRVPSNDPMRRGKRTYCCKVPANGPIEDCNQFRAYSHEAAPVCLRWAITNGYSSGKLSEGECGDECP